MDIVAACQIEALRITYGYAALRPELLCRFIDDARVYTLDKADYEWLDAEPKALTGAPGPS